MSSQFLEHGEDPSGIARREHRNLPIGGAGEADHDGDFERRAPLQAAPEAPDPFALDGLEKHMYVGQDEDGEEQFNNAWMRDHWHGRQGGAGEGMMQARGSLGGGIGADILAAERAFEAGTDPVFNRQAAPQAQAAPKSRWQRFTGFFNGTWKPWRWGKRGRR